MNRKIEGETIETAPVRNTHCRPDTKQFRTSEPIFRRVPTDADVSVENMADPKVAMFFTKREGVDVRQSMDRKPNKTNGVDAIGPSATNDRLDYEQVFHSLSAACAILDRDFRFVEMNDDYAAALKATREHLLGKRVLDVFPEIAEHQVLLTGAFDTALTGKQASLKEILYAIPDSAAEGGMRRVWWNAYFTPLTDRHGRVTHVLLRVRDITEQVKAREMKDAIAGEMQHRIGNLLAMVTIVARQTVRGHASFDQFLPEFESRIQSLAKTHSLLTGGNRDGMTMDRLIHQQLDIYADKLNKTIFVEGPNLHVTAVEAQSISMALHELATNAAKYGALAKEGGRLAISWGKVGDGFQFEWKETGLIGVTEPVKSGFGTMILTQILPSQLNGKATREFRKDGCSYRLRVNEREGAPITP
ncbi:PAS domain-containing protein (plasmid) [Pseudohalocynthiibacter aestuariivivens]|nr:HWE histidine kinase domain-containing protein [Pseudohalocynthiibacter aestuariivivens]QIE47879.1 PAS domain-containing protein [Pseudohalocynthiibacter aestuariivivens]